MHVPEYCAEVAGVQAFEKSDVEDEKKNVIDIGESSIRPISNSVDTFVIFIFTCSFLR